MSDETGNGNFVLYCLSGCYAEVHIRWEITFEINYSYHIRCVIEIFYYLCNVLVAIIAKMLEIKYEC